MPIELPAKLQRITGTGIAKQFDGRGPHGGEASFRKNRGLVTKIGVGYVSRDGLFYPKSEATGYFDYVRNIFYPGDKLPSDGKNLKRIEAKSDPIVAETERVKAQTAKLQKQTKMKLISPPASQSLLSIANAIGDKPAARNLVEEPDDVQQGIDDAKHALKKGSFIVAASFVVMAIVGAKLLRK